MVNGNVSINDNITVTLAFGVVCEAKRKFHAAG